MMDSNAKNENNLHLIIEEPYFSPVEILQTYDIEIIKEEHSRQGTQVFPKVRFKAILQEADTVNKNGRKYPKQVLQEVVDYFNNIIKVRKGIPGELNHPLVEGEIAKQRMTRIDLDNIAVIYKNFEFDGKYVIAEAVTASTRKGMDLYGLIVEDNYNVGFSLRALGSVKPIYEQDGQKILLVEKIHRPVTYDVVDNPSHSSARIISLTENTIPNNNKKNNKSILLNENVAIESTIDNNTITLDYFISPAFKISEKTLNQAKYDKDLNELITSILEDSIEIQINNETIRICKDNNVCMIIPFEIENMIDAALTLYFPPEISNQSKYKLITSPESLKISTAYQKLHQYLIPNTNNLFNVNKYNYIPYLISNLINPNNQLFLNTESAKNTNKLIEEIQYSINTATITNNDNNSAANSLFEEYSPIDETTILYEHINNIDELETLINNAINDNELNTLIHYFITTQRYEDLNELLQFKTIDEELEFYLDNLPKENNIDNNSSNNNNNKIDNDNDITKQTLEEIELEIKNIIDDLITDDTI